MGAALSSPREDRPKLKPARSSSLRRMYASARATSWRGAAVSSTENRERPSLDDEPIAREGRGQLLLRLGELGLLLGEVELELLLLILDLGHLLLQLLGVVICKQPSQQHHKEWRERERERDARERQSM